MLSFAPVDLDNAVGLAPLLAAQPYRSCDYTAGNIFQWRAYFSSLFAVEGGMLIMSVDYPGEGRYYTCPVGEGNPFSAFDAIEADAAARGLPLRFCCVPEEALPLLRARYGERCRLSSRRDWADYLYNARDLMDFPGRRYHTQRNHLNRFNKDNPGAAFVPVDESTLPRAMAFLDEYERFAPVDKVIEAEEMLRAEELLRCSLRLNQKAGFIETGGVIVALSVGEVVQDTLYVHVEKARVDYAGAYQAIVSRFARYACGEDTLYINREDDSGEEGLRYSKLAYRPVRLIEKYWADILT
ncbi:MAG: phosphatidylglycerol lysyltransferase domain-containing protein [Clostridia bacterium]|nr:phosphatidylglycerol lysyltransferase domain-containing protein [Clostridia bacterium]